MRYSSSDSLYFSDKVSFTIWQEKFDFKQYKQRDDEYIDELDIDFRRLLIHLLTHYLSIVKQVYGERNFLKHIPKVMRQLSEEFNISDISNNPFFFTSFSDKNYKEMIKKPKRYKCENTHFHTKIVRVLEYSAIVNKMIIYRSSNQKPRMLKQLAAETYINSKEWIYTSILDVIQYNFNDMFFSNNCHEKYTFYDILLIKFVFQYFLKRNDTNFPVFKLICKCTHGLKNKKHVKVMTPFKSHFLDESCVLCNAIGSRTLKKYFHNENRNICLCED